MSSKKPKPLSRAELVKIYETEVADHLRTREELEALKGKDRYGHNLFISVEVQKQCIEEASITARSEAKDSGQILSMERFNELLKGFCDAAKLNYGPIPR